MSDFSEKDFDIGRFSYLHYGEKFYRYKYHPFGALVSSDMISRCSFTSDFVLDGNSLPAPGHVVYKFPKDMVWSGDTITVLHLTPPIWHTKKYPDQ